MTDTDTEVPLATAIGVLLAAAQQVNTAALRAIDGLPWEEAATMLRDLRSSVADHIGPVDASLTRHLYLVAPHGQTEVEGLGVLEVRRSVDRKNWASQSGAYDYVAAKITANDGEFPDPSQVVEWVLEVAGIGYLRTTALRAAHLDPEDYCTSTPGKPSVKFT